MFIQIDDREKQSRIDNAIKYYSENYNDECVIKHLPFGDFVFENQVVIEYKSLKDFVNSVKSHRVFNQAIDQSFVFSHHFIIVVSNERERRGYFNKLKHLSQSGLYFDEKMYIGAIARLNTYTTVIQANNELEAFLYMRSQARKCLDNKHIIKRLEQKTDNPAFNFLMNIKHISDVKAETIVDGLQLYSLEDLLNITNNDLQSLNGIGSTTAGIIMKAIKGKTIWQSYQTGQYSKD